MHACNPSVQDTEAGGSLQVRGKPGLHLEFPVKSRKTAIAKPQSPKHHGGVYWCNRVGDPEQVALGNEIVQAFLSGRGSLTGLGCGLVFSHTPWLVRQDVSLTVTEHLSRRQLKGRRVRFGSWFEGTVHPGEGGMDGM